MKTERRREAEALRDAIIAAANGSSPTEVGMRLDQLRVTEEYAMLNPELPGLLHILGPTWPPRPRPSEPPLPASGEAEPDTTPSPSPLLEAGARASLEVSLFPEPDQGEYWK